MNMKKVIAAVLVVGTMTMAGAAFAGPRFHDRHGSSRAIHWEHKRQVERNHVRAIRRREAVRRHIRNKVMRDRNRSRMKTWKGRW